LNHIREVAVRVIASLESDFKTKREKPIWYNSKRRQDAINDTIDCTNYQNDFRVPTETKDYSTRSLFAGTPKATLQLPGYCGHVPMNTVNPIKLKHSYGQKSREPLYDLRLTKPNFGHLPGYAGKIPGN